MDRLARTGRNKHVDCSIMNTTETPIATDSFPGGNLYRMWAGAYGTKLYVWADSFDSAFETFMEWLDAHAPGCLFPHEAFRDACLDAAAELHLDWDSLVAHQDPRVETVLEHAESDLTSIGHTTLKHGAYIVSHEWGGGDVAADTQEYKDVLARTLAEVLERDVEAIAAELEAVKDEYEQNLCDCCAQAELTPDLCEHGVDVRLALEPDGRWELLTGDVCYDTRHAAYCGASTVSAEDTAETLLETARDLVAQCLDLVAG